MSESLRDRAAAGGAPPAAGCEPGVAPCEPARERWLPGPRWLRALAADVLTCIVIAAVLTLLFRPIFGRTASSTAAVFLVNLVVTLGIGMSCSNAYRYVFPRIVGPDTARPLQLLAHAGVIVVSVLVGTEAAILALRTTVFPEVAASRWEIVQIGVTVCVVVVLMSLAYEGLASRARASELDAERARRQALRAELAALQARTDPHFLFNSLNTVAGLIDEDPAAAERMLELLSDQFRHSLEGSRAERVPLGRELDAARDYLEMQALRFGDRLRSRVTCGDGLERAAVPPLVLVPLVENAVLHGVATRREGGSVRIDARQNGASVVLAVEDDGPGPGGSSHEGAGTSLADLSERLRLLYGGRAALATGAADGGGFRVTVTLPAEDAGDGGRA